MSDYEKTREERIKQNLNRMEKLGIFDLSLKLKSVKPIRKKNLIHEKFNDTILPVRSSEPARRSSRLQNTAPVVYSELRPEKEEKSSKRRINIIYTQGSRPEEYTEEHEKLLGSTEMSWTLFVDGVGTDGKRIYDCVKGKTCHQCRQKTLGQRTHCSECGMVQGQFCGDCLYMRYGEHVVEANQNPEWKCPVCRGICNCSLCRQAKGWAPTGALYKKINQLGFKSVAHYLIQTRRPQAASADTKLTVEDDKNMIPTTDKTTNLKPNTEEVKVMKPTVEEDKDIKPTKEEVKESLIPDIDDSISAVVVKIDEKLEKEAHGFGDVEAGIDMDADKFKGKEVEIIHIIKIENGNDNVAAGKTTRVSKRKKNISCDAGEESIGGRLRQRRRISN